MYAYLLSSIFQVTCNYKKYLSFGTGPWELGHARAIKCPKITDLPSFGKTYSKPFPEQHHHSASMNMESYPSASCFNQAFFFCTFSEITFSRNEDLLLGFHDAETRFDFKAAKH